ncbi:hypothetical protein AC249_AIPGENE7445, partial [Exaiptasia diaphana]
IVNVLSSTPVTTENGATITLGDFCSTCRYNLQIEVIDQYGQQVNHNLPDPVPFTADLDPDQPCYDPTTGQNNSTSGITYNSGDLIYNLNQIGEYRIIKKLWIDYDAMHEDFTAQLDLTGANDPQSFLTQYTANIDYSDCFDNCDDYCWAYQKYLYDSQHGVGQWDQLDSLNDQLPLVNACIAKACDPDEIYQNPDPSTSGSNPTINPMDVCAQKEAQMLAQISPGGIYYDPGSFFWSNVANSGLAFPISADGTTYTYGELQNPASFPNGTYGPELAAILLQYHREYCHIIPGASGMSYCEWEAESNNYSQALITYMTDQTWPTTVVSGSVFDTPYQITGTTLALVYTQDPFITSPFNGASNDLLQNYVTNYIQEEFGGSGFDCVPNSSFDLTSGDLFAYISALVDCISSTAPPGTAPSVWEEMKRIAFRSTYDNIKRDLMLDYMANNCSYYNDGNEIFNGIASDDQDAIEGNIQELLSNMQNPPNCELMAATNTANWIHNISDNCLNALESAGEY